METFDTKVMVQLLVEDDPARSAAALRCWRSALAGAGVFGARSDTPASECLVDAPPPGDSAATRRWSVRPCSHAGAWEQKMAG
jgi:hypothetical protein